MIKVSKILVGIGGRGHFPCPHVPQCPRHRESRAQPDVALLMILRWSADRESLSNEPFSNTHQERSRLSHWGTWSSLSMKLKRSLFSKQFIGKVLQELVERVSHGGNPQ